VLCLLQVKVLHEDAQKADEMRRAVLREAEIAERASKAACEAHSNAKEALWAAESRLGELLERVAKKQQAGPGGGDGRGSMEVVHAGSVVMTPVAAGKPVDVVLEPAHSVTPSYIS